MHVVGKVADFSKFLQNNKFPRPSLVHGTCPAIQVTVGGEGGGGGLCGCLSFILNTELKVSALNESSLQGFLLFLSVFHKCQF